MKRIIALLLVLTLAFSLAGCASAEEKEAAKAVSTQIEELTDVTLADAAKVAEAQEAYDDLTEKARKRVKNDEILEEAHAELADIVTGMIDDIGTVTLDSEAAIAAAQNAYDSLHENAQELVENYSELEDAIEELVSVFTREMDDLTVGLEDITAAMDIYDVVTVVTLIEEKMPVAEKIANSSYFVSEDDPIALLNNVRDLMVQACYPNTHIITLDNFIKLDSVYNATASSNEGESCNTDSTTGMEYHTYVYSSATAMANAFLAYEEYLSTYFELEDVEAGSSSAKYVYADDLGRQFYVKWAYFNLGQYGTYNMIYVGFAPEVGLSASLNG